MVVNFEESAMMDLIEIFTIVKAKQKKVAVHLRRSLSQRLSLHP